MKKAIILGAFVLSVFSFAFVLANEPGLTAKDRLQLKDFEVLGIKMFDSMDETLKKFGEPLKVENYYVNKFKTYFFADIDIHCYSPLNDGLYIVDGVTVKKEGYTTYRGISVGDDESRVTYLYGKGSWYDEVVYYETRFDDEIPYGIYFSIKDNKVSSFKVYIPFD